MFLKWRAIRFLVPVLVLISVILVVIVIVTNSFIVLENSLQQKEVGGAKVEGRPNSTILAVEGSWQCKKGIV